MLDLQLLNDGETSTFRRNGRTSIVDVTFCSQRLATGADWRVLEDDTLSDHQAIRFSVGHTRGPSGSGYGVTGGWRTQCFHSDTFLAALSLGGFGIAPTSAAKLVDVLSDACDATMPRRRPSSSKRRPKYWWNQAIKELRTACTTARRKQLRDRSDVRREELKLVYQAARSALKREIKASKRRCFLDLCREAERNVWGNAYRVVVNKLKGQPPPERCPTRLRAIIEELFPQHDLTTRVLSSSPAEELSTGVVPVTNEELLDAVRLLRLDKAPGPDGNPECGAEGCGAGVSGSVQGVVSAASGNGRVPCCMEEAEASPSAEARERCGRPSLIQTSGAAGHNW
ncbi:uncharacterized protein LOC131292912 [Anopheles ziemanni]|uniref:uncharacterized protein LOC131271262 n=1 Tax=Anopheles coustani TaxID=139045 RepID=UPI002657BADC|nr:uncharacterized protein LOC131271262 [Anopheles coustani]XP_058176993.1 uncharacterized protein LOC131292912 [Anopheles ziemanni]